MWAIKDAIFCFLTVVFLYMLIFFIAVGRQLKSRRVEVFLTANLVVLLCRTVMQLGVVLCDWVYWLFGGLFSRSSSCVALPVFIVRSGIIDSIDTEVPIDREPYSTLDDAGDVCDMPSIPAARSGIIDSIDTEVPIDREPYSTLDDVTYDTVGWVFGDCDFGGSSSAFFTDLCVHSQLSRVDALVIFVFGFLVWVLFAVFLFKIGAETASPAKKRKRGRDFLLPRTVWITPRYRPQRFLPLYRRLHRRPFRRS